MKPTEFWFWNVKSETAPFKVSPTRWRMTEAQALQRYPEATRVPGSCEIRHLPETQAEFVAILSGPSKSL